MTIALHIFTIAIWQVSAPPYSCDRNCGIDRAQCFSTTRGVYRLDRFRSGCLIGNNKGIQGIEGAIDRDLLRDRNVGYF
jgi:hypothetical protein